METCCHSGSREKPFANADEKNSQMCKIIIIINQKRVAQSAGAVTPTVTLQRGKIPPQ